MATISNVTFALGIAETPYSTEAAKNATYYYNTQGDATAEYFLTANVGTVTLSNGYANVSMTANLDKLNPQESKAYAIVIRRGSASGPIIASSNTINIINDDILFHQADGGNTVVTGGYKIHEFRSSGNLTVNIIGAPVNNQVDYVIVAGGGGSGSPPGAGGGAGGMLTGNNSSSIITEAGNVLVIVGSGGAIGSNGANSSLGSFLLSVGGGRGNGGNGGSGGGGQNPFIAGGTSIAGQGNPGGGWEGPSERRGAGGGGAGAAGALSLGQGWGGYRGGFGGAGRGISWTTPFIGTTGPTPGRWFAGGGGGNGNPTGGRVPPSYSETNGNGGAGGGGGNLIPTGAGVIYTGGGGGTGYNPGTGITTQGAGGSGAIAIRYPFKPSPTYTVNSTVSRIDSNSSMTYAIVTNGLTANARFYYTLTGNVTSADIDTPLSGSFIVSNNRANIKIVSNSAAITNSVFALQMRRLSTTGKILATGNTILIAPSPYIEATGGIVTDSGGYRIHTFISSGNLNISYAGTSPTNIETLIVAGGGGGQKAGGGGGAGGLQDTQYEMPSSFTGNVVVVVGAGGAGGITFGSPIYALALGQIGSNSSVLGLISYGGGGGGGLNGGSGGGGLGFGDAGGEGVYPGSSFISAARQGYPGGASLPGSPYAIGGGGGAGQNGVGGSGQNSGPGGNGISIPWIPALYGTTGPTPGRWFGGGGGGGGNNYGNPLGQGVFAGNGGAGGGAAGSSNKTVGGTAPPGGTGTENTGGGGGGGSLDTSMGGAGGSGIVIIRYPYQ